jgi:hypothetical protein
MSGCADEALWRAQEREENGASAEGTHRKALGLTAWNRCNKNAILLPGLILINKTLGSGAEIGLTTCSAGETTLVPGQLHIEGSFPYKQTFRDKQSDPAST